MSLDSLALLIDTYWIFLAAALAIGVVVGWIAANADTKSNNN